MTRPDDVVEQALEAPSERPSMIDLGILEELTGFYLRAAYEACYNDFATVLGPDKLKPGSFALMSLIFENPGITQVELARGSGRDKSSVAIALRQLEDSGLIRRVRLEGDRRSYASYLTSAGETLYQRMIAKARTHIERVDAIVGPERKAILLTILKDIVDGLQAD
ncbi:MULTISPECIES: MarR family winged helix-turn-helix transcriptional regulator [Chelativorans]|uniref:Transcriptional regulator, MarR family n=1 Tax=Chelativorans sp. (strain BNC1) TaxID=266779 RepID=Q11DV9_CHESB|nr:MULTISPECIES: MarR family transcriptional regulator [Chelativorans]